MSLSAAVVAELVAAGLSGEALVSACARIEAAGKPARSSAAERQARYRERQKASLVTSRDACDVTDEAALPPPVSPLSPSPRPLTQNPPLSPTNPKATACANALDGEAMPPIAKPKPPPSASRGCRIPPGFPGDAERDWFKSEMRLTDDDFTECRDEFRDYWSGVPGQRGVKCDWAGTFRNAARKFRPRSRSRQAYPAGNQRTDGSMLGAYQRAAASFQPSNDVPERRPGVFGDGNGELEVRYGTPAE
jgi:hypothetical protein